MCDFTSLDRCASYVAARMALIAVQRAAGCWPGDLGARARAAAIDTLELTAEAVAHGHATAGRRHCLRRAMITAISVAAIVDVARAIGLGGDELVEVQRLAGRTVALLGMFFHATTSLAAPA